jgi:hypothetical protein
LLQFGLIRCWPKFLFSLSRYFFLSIPDFHQIRTFTHAIALQMHFLSSLLYSVLIPLKIIAITTTLSDTSTQSHEFKVSKLFHTLYLHQIYKVFHPSHTYTHTSVSLPYSRNSRLYYSCAVIISQHLTTNSLADFKLR